MLHEMLKLVVNAHHGQFDKGGVPYAFHCLAVMKLLPESADEEQKCMALGHDLFEDTDVTYEEVFAAFGTRVAQGILAMTKQKGVAYEDYITVLMKNKDAVMVKMADLRHNSDITRLKGVTEKDIKRMEKYAKTYTRLKNA